MMTNNFEEPNQEPDTQESAANEPRVVMNTQQQTVRIRRAPKFSSLMILGAVLGLIAALILAVMFQTEGGETTWQQVFGYLFLPSAAIGGALFGVLALLLDRNSQKHTSTVNAEQYKIKTAEPDAVDTADIAETEEESTPEGA